MKRGPGSFRKTSRYLRLCWQSSITRLTCDVIVSQWAILTHWLIITIEHIIIYPHHACKYCPLVYLTLDNKTWTHDDVIKWKHFPRYFLCGEFTGPGEFPTQRPVTRSFDVFFDLRLNKRLSGQSWGWCFGTLSCPLLRNRNVQRNLPKDIFSSRNGIIIENRHFNRIGLNFLWVSISDLHYVARICSRYFFIMIKRPIKYLYPSKSTNTVWCRLNAVNFLQNSQTRHSIAKYGVSFCDLYSASVATGIMQYHVTWDRVKTASNCILRIIRRGWISV